MPALLSVLALLACGAPGARAERLTIERLFAAPDLAGQSLRSPRIAPDGRLIAYLKGAADDKDRLDLWAYDLRTHAHRRLIDARALLPPGGGALSAEEAARRERQRSSALSGIVEYAFASDSQLLLVPLGGELYLYDLGAPEDRAVRRLTHGGGYATDARFSPRGRFVSFIRERNLWVLDLSSGREWALTHATEPTESYGVAEFIAQEEMDRDTGYWWAPDESRIAFTRVDESPVAETQRFEINATDVQVVRQRYPYAGSANARVELYVAALVPAAAPVKVEFGADADSYLARVQFLPDSLRLAVQWQSRDQKTLQLVLADAVRGSASVLVTEHNPHWIALNDDLRFLKKSPRFIWASDRSGFRHLYLYDLSGRLLRQLTSGESMTIGDDDSGLKGVDEKHGYVYFMSNASSVLERQLYRVPLDHPAAPQRVTVAPGWHSVRMAEDASVFLDTYSDADTPPQVTLRTADGTAIEALVPNRLDAGHPYFPYRDQRAPREFGELTASDGQVLHFELTRPARLEPGKRYPVIVYVYGGPHVQNVQNSWGGSWQMFEQLLANEGFVVFTLDNRGSGKRGERFESASWRHLSDVEVEDQVAGVRFLRSLPFVAPDRIGLFGWSYGGYMALQGILRAPESFAAAVAGAPVTDWRLYDTHYTERYLGTPAENPDGYRSAGVLTYAAQLRRPLLVIHGMADDNVLFQHSTLLMKRLQDLDLPFELMTYPGGKHGLIRHQDQGPHAMHAILEFFTRTLKAQP